MTVTEAQMERWVDLMVCKRLATDSAYNNAENAEAQAQREEEITEEVLADLRAKHHGEPS